MRGRRRTPCVNSRRGESRASTRHAMSCRHSKGESAEKVIRWRDMWTFSYGPVLLVNDSQQIIGFNPSAEKLFRDILERRRYSNVAETIVQCLPIQRILEDRSPGCNLTVSACEGFFAANILPVDDNRCLVFLNDLTEVRQLESKVEAFVKTNKELNYIINSSADGLVSVDANGILIRMNEACEKIVGVRAEDFIGGQAIRLVEEGHVPDAVSRHVIKDLKPKNLYLKINGREVLITGKPVFDSNGQLILVVINIRDMTALNNLRKEIQKFNQLKQQFTTELERLRAKEVKGVLVGDSLQIKKVIRLTIQAAHMGSSILITGETGTGKELVAKMIHRNSQRKDGPFIAVNCSALPGPLLESELFGYETGSFTGADKKGRAGLFEAADGGTLFLDEIGELPLEMQVKLLRAIQEKRIRRLGGAREFAVNIRLVSATNRNLKKLVEDGRFREDLFYRLNVINILIPSLKERREDIPILTEYILEKFNKKFNVNKMISPKIMTRLQAYDWPGNVRELENIIERFVVLSRGQDLEPDIIHSDIFSNVSLPGTNTSLKDILENTEKEVIVRAYRECGSTRKAAKRLGISQATMTRKLQKYGWNAEANDSSVDRCDSLL
ncbi:MAG: DNA-binding transcriptional activator HyfR [Syntrophomonadaceae bacterium]|nr:DNA-binding transcriptional activator HyfR [Bacillota bacterium]